MSAEQWLAVAGVLQAVAAAALVANGILLFRMERSRHRYERMEFWVSALNLFRKETTEATDKTDAAMQELVGMLMSRDLQEFARVLGRENPALAKLVFERVARLGQDSD